MNEFPMTDKENIRTSKFLSLILRHEPQRVGLKLGEAGWVKVTELLEALNRHGGALTLDQLRHLVATSDKKRFAFSDDGQQIRANQGHSVEVDLQYTPQTPPEILYHGTVTRHLISIQEKGLLKMARHHVHLSAETKTTFQVGARHGKPVLLTVRAGDMQRSGHIFYCSTNGVWLVDHVSAKFIGFPAAPEREP
jgi:putative RNA 2'-phosphotransferase